tara:strand:- start:22151 stop:23224 length:1074 start_codon:yes stop_codon:yes gene_type:complete
MIKNKIYDLSFSNQLVSWYQKEKRNLPFRKTKDPYRVWLSEIILQQTQMKTGLKYYNVFIKYFPKIEILASASEEKIYSLWKGLGYYNRAKNLLKTAKLIVEKYNSHFPKTSKELILLPGVGKYTASAIASICYNEKTPVVDANVYRVLSRYFRIKNDISKSDAYCFFFNKSKTISNNVKNMGDYNQAIMDFGSKICAPKKPQCTICFLKKHCLAYKKKDVLNFPIKKRINKKKKRIFNYCIIEMNDFYLIQKRIKKDIWMNLLEFYMIENENVKKAQVSLKNKFKKFKLSPKIKSKNHKGVLSHQIITANFFSIKITEKATFKAIKKEYKLQKIKKIDLIKSATPKVIDNYLKSDT